MRTPPPLMAAMLAAAAWMPTDEGGPTSARKRGPALKKPVDKAKRAKRRRAKASRKRNR